MRILFVSAVLVVSAPLPMGSHVQVNPANSKPEPSVAGQRGSLFLSFGNLQIVSRDREGPS
jgi:hypothetical protein